MTDIIPSIHIKHIFADISEDNVIKIIEEKFKFGKVDKIYSRFKRSEKDGHKYYSCDIHFKSWSNDVNAIEMFGKGTRLNYNGDEYWEMKLFNNRYHNIKP